MTSTDHLPVITADTRTILGISRPHVVHLLNVLHYAAPLRSLS